MKASPPLRIEEPIGPAGEVAAKKKPSLWFGESMLRRAHEALAEADVDGAMPLDEAVALVRTFVDPAGVIEKRDELATFLIESERFAEAKKAHAAVLSEQARRILHGVSVLERQAVRFMEDFGVDQLAGNLHVLKLKKSPGAVAVDDEAAIPEAYFTVTSDADLEAIRDLVGIVVALTPETRETNGAIEPDEDRQKALDLLAAAELRRRRVDKKAIQEAWRQEGSDVRKFVVSLERKLPDGRIATTEGLVPTVVPVVPGTHKDVTTSLVIK